MCCVIIKDLQLRLSSITLTPLLSFSLRLTRVKTTCSEKHHLCNGNLRAVEVNI